MHQVVVLPRFSHDMGDAREELMLNIHEQICPIVADPQLLASSDPIFPGIS